MRGLCSWLRRLSACKFAAGSGITAIGLGQHPATAPASDQGDRNAAPSVPRDLAGPDRAGQNLQPPLYMFSGTELLPGRDVRLLASGMGGPSAGPFIVIVHTGPGFPHNLSQLRISYDG